MYMYIEGITNLEESMKKEPFLGHGLKLFFCVCVGGCLLATLPYSRQTERNVMKSNEAYI